MSPTACDDLNTHTKAAFCESFTPAQACQLDRRIKFRYMPKSANWLNITGNEQSSLTYQCVVGRPFGNTWTLRAETTACSSDLNSTQCSVDWRMKIDDAHCELKSVYPTIKL